MSRILARIGRVRDPAVIYRWTYPRGRRGSGGLVPSGAWDDILAAAHALGIEVPAEAFDPRPTDDGSELIGGDSEPELTAEDLLS